VTRDAGLTLRPATPHDAALLLCWRNEEAAVHYSRTGRSVTEAEHAAWIERRLSLPRPLLWIAVEGQTPVGQVRFDVDANAHPRTGEVAITVDAAHRRRGAGTAILHLVQGLASDLGLDCLDAWIHSANAASLRAFARSGFEEQDRDGQFLRMRWCTRVGETPRA